MEAVRAFNNELSSLYEVRPPISRAKMANVTKCAIKAIKFYKHVVQSVEKFIQKCKPEYKVPGLYVIDSIIRQSRHQFGSEKDAFAPRFTKNIVSTFQNLFKCPPDEKSKVIRVLNLWQKNNVLPVNVIQPLLDLAADPNNVDLVLIAQRAVEKAVTAHQQKTHGGPGVAGHSHPAHSKGEERPAPQDVLATQNDMLATVTKLLQQTDEGPTSLSSQQQQLQQLHILQQQLMQQTELMQKPQEAGPVIDNNLLAQIQTLTNQLLSKTTGDGKGPPEPGFNKKLLDFDYGESDEEDERRMDGSHGGGIPGSEYINVQNILNDPTIMQHIHQMSQTLQKSGHLQPDMTTQEQLHKKMLLQQQEEFDKEISQGRGFGMEMQQAMYMNQSQGDEMDLDTSQDDKKDEHHRSAHRSRDRSRSPKKRKRSRSRSRERRRRSRSRERHRRSRSRERGDRESKKEKEKERRKKGLPAIKEKHVSVCSTTLWIGHISKYTTEEELREEIEKYGVVESVNMIPPRGCAYVCMGRRKDAYRAVEKMAKGCKINGSTIRIAFAPGIGVKGVDYKEGWNAEFGVTYIAWNKLPLEINPLCEGGMIDEDSLPAHLRGMKFGRQEEPDQDSQGASTSQPETVQMQPVPSQPQFGAPMPGVVPVLPPHMMPPVMMPVPGQMPPGQLPHPQMPGQLQPGQIPQMPQVQMTQARMPQTQLAPGQLPPGLSQIRLPQGPGPAQGIPVPHSMAIGTLSGAVVRPQMTVVSLSSKPLETASAQLSQAIHNIMSTSIPTPGVQQPPRGAPRPSFPPPGSYPNFNPNVPPPNFRPPMPGTPVRLPFGAPGQPGKPSDDNDSESGMDWGGDKEPEDTDERMPSQGPGFPRVFGQPMTPGTLPTSMPVSLPSLMGSPQTRGPRPLLQQSPQIPGMPPRPPMTLGQRPGLLVPGEQPTLVIQGPPGTPTRPPGPGGPPVSMAAPMPHMQGGPRGPAIGLSPRGFPGPGPTGPRPGLLGFRPGHPGQGFRFTSPAAGPGVPPNFRGPRPPFGMGPSPEMDRSFPPDGPPVGPPVVDMPPEFNHGDKIERFRDGRPPPLLGLDSERERWNSNDRRNSMENMQGGFRRDFEGEDEEFDRFGSNRDMGRDRERDIGRGRDMDRERGRDFRGRDRDSGRGFGQGGQFLYRNERSPRSDRSSDRDRDRERDRERDYERDRDRDRERDRDRDRERDRDRDRGRRGGRNEDRDKRGRSKEREGQETRSRPRDRSGRQSRWSHVDETPAEAVVSSSEVPNEGSTEKPSEISNSSAPPAEVSSEVPAESTTEVPNDAPAEMPTEGPVDKLMDAPSEGPPDASSEVQTGIPTDTPTDMPMETAASSTDMPKDSPAEIRAENVNSVRDDNENSLRTAPESDFTEDSAVPSQDAQESFQEDAQEPVQSMGFQPQDSYDSTPVHDENESADFSEMPENTNVSSFNDCVPNSAPVLDNSPLNQLDNSMQNPEPVFQEQDEHLNSDSSNFIAGNSIDNHNFINDNVNSEGITPVSDSAPIVETSNGPDVLDSEPSNGPVDTPVKVIKESESDSSEAVAAQDSVSQSTEGVES